MEKMKVRLEEISTTFSIEMENLNRFFQMASCDFSVLEAYLSTKNKELLWNPLEDHALNLEDDSVEFQYLLEIKGEEAIEARRKFLTKDEGSDDIELAEEIEDAGSEPKEESKEGDEEESVQIDVVEECQDDHSAPVQGDEDDEPEEADE